MTGRLRKAIYSLFLLAFFITAPTVVLYTAGYRLNLQTLHVVKTGLLSVATVQKGADVYVDGKKGNGKTPTLIDDLLPGIHAVRIEKAGSIPWEKKLPIESQRTTFAQNIVLFADATASEEVTGDVVAFDTAEDGRMAYALSQAGWIEIWTADQDGGNRRLLSRVPDANAVALRLSKDGSFVSVGATRAKSSDLTLVNTSTGDTTQASDLVQNVTDGWWDAGQGDRYFLRTSGRTAGIYAITLPQGTVAKLPVPPESQAASVMSDGNAFLVLIPTNVGMAVTRWNGTAAKLITSVDLSAPAFVQAPDGLAMLVDTKAKAVALIDTSKVGDEAMLLNATATAEKWLGKRLLYTDGHELDVFDVGADMTQAITRANDPILAVAWHPAGSVVAYAQASGVYAIELDDRDHRIMTKLAEGSNILGAWIDPKGHALRFVGTVGATSGIFVRPL